MNAIEFLVWCMANGDKSDADMKARYETLCETDQHRLQRAIRAYGKPEDAVSQLVGDDSYE